MQDGDTALTCAAEAGHAAIVLMLLETKPGVHDTVSALFQGPVAIPSDNVTSSQSKNEAMIRAAREGHVAVVQALLDAGVSKGYAVRSTGFLIHDTIMVCSDRDCYCSTFNDMKLGQQPVITVRTAFWESHRNILL
jgi:ankyrin repeat protein